MKKFLTFIFSVIMALQCHSMESPALLKRHHFLLDQINCAKGEGWSVRRISSSFSGSQITVRRTTGNVQRNLFYLSDGSLDVYDMTAFSQSGLYCVQLNDQVGIGRSVIQSTSSQQPVLMLSGSLYTINNKPVLNFVSANNDLLKSNSFTPIIFSSGSSSLSVIYYSTTTTLHQTFFDESPSATTGFYGLGTDQTVFTTPSAFFRNSASTTILNAVQTTPNNVTGKNVVSSFIDTGSALSEFVNGSPNTVQTYTRSGTLVPQLTCLGALYSIGGNYDMMNGEAGEWIVLPFVQTNSDFSTTRILEYNYWGISGQ